MKQYVVLISMIALGIYIFHMIAGSQDGSLSTSLQHLWQKGVELRAYTP